ncbi:hypothetical protein DEA8626_03855 [Defluviimonas aquaemixtae]|uniref:Uncharacterized protein n=1 Tax=Albidovulum aquaemixtae TaxID=1542388 RepID=A0A2R8BN80_9RHOB|nr:hypothetical protein [Defluviimonas aquaemixtae]SPH24822.1 hypothetical protein DEA8626_03855 [Defluviimonas aquaemixtae]
MIQNGHHIGLPAMALLAACGPMSVERAEDVCFERARLAAGPRGLIAVGGGSGGAASKVRLELSTEWIQGKDPSALYISCVHRKSGSFPRRQLYDRPDWKG